MIPYPQIPEIYTLIGIIIFIGSSFITYFFNVSEIFGNFLSGFLTLLYQIFALIGLLQMFFFNFVFSANIETRAVTSFIYLVAATISLIVFITLIVKQSEYLSYYFRYTFLSGPLLLLRIIDAVSEIRDPFTRLFHRNR